MKTLTEVHVRQRIARLSVICLLTGIPVFSSFAQDSRNVFQKSEYQLSELASINHPDIYNTVPDFKSTGKDVSPLSLKPLNSKFVIKTDTSWVFSYRAVNDYTRLRLTDKISIYGSPIDFNAPVRSSNSLGISLRIRIF